MEAYPREEDCCAFCNVTQHAVLTIGKAHWHFYVAQWGSSVANNSVRQVAHTVVAATPAQEDSTYPAPPGGASNSDGNTQHDISCLLNKKRTKEGNCTRK